MQGYMNMQFCAINSIAKSAKKLISVKRHMQNICKKIAHQKSLSVEIAAKAIHGKVIVIDMKKSVSQLHFTNVKFVTQVSWL